MILFTTFHKQFIYIYYLVGFSIIDCTSPGWLDEFPEADLRMVGAKPNDEFITTTDEGNVAGELSAGGNT